MVNQVHSASGRSLTRFHNRSIAILGSEPWGGVVCRAGFKTSGWNDLPFDFFGFPFQSRLSFQPVAEELHFESVGPSVEIDAMCYRGCFIAYGAPAFTCHDVINFKLIAIIDV